MPSSCSFAEINVAVNVTGKAVMHLVRVVVISQFLLVGGDVPPVLIRAYLNGLIRWSGINIDLCPLAIYLHYGESAYALCFLPEEGVDSRVRSAEWTPSLCIPATIFLELPLIDHYSRPSVETNIMPPEELHTFEPCFPGSELRGISLFCEFLLYPTSLLLLSLFVLGDGGVEYVEQALFAPDEGNAQSPCGRLLWSWHHCPARSRGLPRHEECLPLRFIVRVGRITNFVPQHAQLETRTLQLRHRERKATDGRRLVECKHDVLTGLGSLTGLQVHRPDGGSPLGYLST